MAPGAEPESCSLPSYENFYHVKWYMKRINPIKVCILETKPVQPCGERCTSTLQWRHNEHDSVSNHRPHHYLHQWNKCFVYMLYDACLYYIYVYIYYIYWNICMMKFLWNFILEFFFKQIGNCHGTGFVVAGGTAGCHNNLRCRQGWQSGLCGSSRLFNVQCIQCTHDLSLLAPIFHPKLSKMLHSSPVRARYGVSFVSYGFWW